MRNTISNDTKESIADGIAECTGKTAGSLAGCAIGAVFAGPGGAAAGAIAGAAIEQIFQKAGDGIKKRLLAPSEDKRVGTVYVQAKQIPSKNVQKGTIRETTAFSMATKRTDLPAKSFLRVC